MPNQKVWRPEHPPWQEKQNPNREKDKNNAYGRQKFEKILYEYTFTVHQYRLSNTFSP